MEVNENNIIFWVSIDQTMSISGKMNSMPNCLVKQKKFVFCYERLLVFMCTFIV